MKVSIVGQFGQESFGLHIKENLQSMGHNVVSCVSVKQEFEKKEKVKRSIINKVSTSFQDKLKFASASSRSHIMKNIIKEITKEKCDLIICTYDYFTDYEITYIRNKTGSKVVLWYPDHVANFGRATFLNAGYDFLFFKDPYLVREINKIYNKPVAYLPEAFSTIRHTIPDFSLEDQKEYACDISIIGNLHSFRVALLEQLSDYDLRIYGSTNPWWLNIKGIEKNYTGKYLAYEEKGKAVRYSKINLNTLYIGEFEGVNVRTFELAGLRGFQIIENKPGLSALFTPDKEIVTYESINELRNKIDYYLKHEEERKAIAEAAYEHAIKAHTYKHRLDRMLRIIEREHISEDDIYDYTV